MKRHLCPALALAFICFAFSTPAMAQVPLGPGVRGVFPAPQAFAGVGAYRSPASLYSLGKLFVPPYFSMHPPVYYSLPVPRTYGYSPFAYPDTVMTPELEIPEAKLTVNPYYKAVPAVQTGKIAENSQNPVIQTNPFYRGRADVNLAENF